MLPEVKVEALRRLSYIEGHVAAVKRMVEGEAYCVDVLKQSFAVRRALQRVESLVLDGHLKTHVREGVRSGNEEVLTELLELYNQASK